MHVQHGDERFPRGEMNRKLSRLARSMKETSQSVFLMENLQPTWLPIKRQQREYVVLTRVAFWIAAVYPLTLHGLAMTVIAYFGSMETPIDAGVFFAVFMVVLRLQTRRRGIGRDIRTFERLGWSWRAALRTAAISGGVAAAIMAVIILIVDLVQGDSVDILDLLESAAAIGGMIGCGVFVFAGWSRTALAGKSRPNDGMRMTLKNAVVVAGALTSVFIIGLTAGLLGGEYLTTTLGPSPLPIFRSASPRFSIS